MHMREMLLIELTLQLSDFHLNYFPLLLKLVINSLCHLILPVFKLFVIHRALLVNLLSHNLGNLIIQVSPSIHTKGLLFLKDAFTTLSNRGMRVLIHT